MEDIVGGWWDRLITRVAYQGHPEAAVTLAEVERTAPVFFRAMGGDAALTVRSAVGTEHGARRRWLERIAGTGDRVELAWQDARSLYLPDVIDHFPDRALNRQLYFWLMALAAEARAGTDWLTANREATARCLIQMPGLAALYRRLVAAHLKTRPDPGRLRGAEAAWEEAIRAALASPNEASALPAGQAACQPVPLWLHPTPPLSGQAEAVPRQGGEAEAEEAARREARKRRRYRAQRVAEDTRKNGMLMVFRAESLFTWDEYVKVNRHNDEDEEDNAAAADDMNRLSVSADATTRASRLRFDLDLPAAAYDDTPLGPGLLLPEWHWKQRRLVEDHVRLVPMLPRDARPAGLPERLRAPARRLRRQFQALAPERTRRRGESSGPDIDLDRVVRFLAECGSGVRVGEPGLYQSRPPGERSLACLLLADLSLSTESWVGDAGQVIDVIRDSLLLFGEALSATGDAFGVYGFSSIRRQEVRFQVLKDFSERFDDTVRGRMLAIRPGYYTRMGAAIRQATRVLESQPAHRRLLLIVSDGKPNDLDHYEGRYGVEDTRMAVREARAAGLLPFCVTVDSEAGEYLPYLFGRNGYTVVTNVRRLPQVLTSLYATLTR